MIGKQSLKDKKYSEGVGAFKVALKEKSYTKVNLMGMAILFRKNKDNRHFRDALLEIAAENIGNELIISSGYIDGTISSSHLANSIEECFRKSEGNGRVLIVGGAFNHMHKSGECLTINRKGEKFPCPEDYINFEGNYRDGLKNYQILVNEKLEGEFDIKFRTEMKKKFTGIDEDGIRQKKNAYVQQLTDSYKTIAQEMANEAIEQLENLKSDYKICWLCHYNFFVWNLSRILDEKVPNMQVENWLSSSPKDKYNHWHSKLSIKLRREDDNKVKIIAAIVGSSNLTTSSFEEKDPPKKECDVFIWVDSFTPIFLKNDEAVRNFEIIEVQPKYSNEEAILQSLYDGLRSIVK